MEPATFRVKVRMKQQSMHETERWLETRKPISERLDSVVERSIESLRSDLAAKPKAPAIPQGFIPHDGGPCPVANGEVVRVVYRDGKFSPFFRQGKNQEGWMHCSKPSDIIAYRIDRDPNFRVEAGKFYITASGERVGPMRSLIGGTFDLGWHDQRIWKASGMAKGGLRNHTLLALAAGQTSPMVSE